MRKKLIPTNFKLKNNYVLTDFRLELLTTANLLEDYYTILANAEIIVKLRADSGGDKNSWPFKFSLEENYKDLAWLEVCADYRQLFAFIMRDLKTNQYLGCVYIYPIELFYPQKAKQYDVDFSFWIIKRLYQQGKYPQIYQALAKWLSEVWPFDQDKIYWRMREKVILAN